MGCRCDRATDHSATLCVGRAPGRCPRRRREAGEAARNIGSFLWHLASRAGARGVRAEGACRARGGRIRPSARSCSRDVGLAWRPPSGDECSPRARFSYPTSDPDACEVDHISCEFYGSTVQGRGSHRSGASSRRGLPVTIARCCRCAALPGLNAVGYSFSGVA